LAEDIGRLQGRTCISDFMYRETTVTSQGSTLRSCFNCPCVEGSLRCAQVDCSR
ncbi:unnamed protein product, partial [Candidula unifasciata]